MSVINPAFKIPESSPYDTSEFTFKDLADINDSHVAYKSPLAVIGHIDLNAFFAQVEQIRLGYTRDDPVVCVQWSSLIAVSYAARKYGIGRLDSIKSARAKCPNVILAHAAVFKQGESHWAYVDGLPSQITHKVSLDPYRRESRKIISIFNQECDLVEKASVDESYLDLGRLIYERLYKDYPQLFENLSSESFKKDSKLPPIPKEHLNLKIYGISESECYTVSDWDDVCMCIGSEIIYNVRQEVFKILGYTTSGGVGRNKFIAKLAGGVYKPDNLGVVFNKNVETFLNRFELTDIGGMGGKTGEEVLYKLNVKDIAGEDKSSITKIRDNFSLHDLKSDLKDDEIAEKVYNLVRGNQPKELTLKVEVKSMMSRKNFPGKPVANLKDAYDWIKVFVGDLKNRLIESDDESMNISSSQYEKQRPTIRRPKTVSLHFGTTDYQSHSKQTTIAPMKDLEKFEELLEVTALRLLKELLDSLSSNSKPSNGFKMKDVTEITRNIKIIGSANMSLTISNFVKTSNNNLLDSFMAKPRSTDSHKKELMAYTAKSPSPPVPGKQSGPKLNLSPSSRSQSPSIFSSFTGNKPTTEQNITNKKFQSRIQENDTNSIVEQLQKVHTRNVQLNGKGNSAYCETCKKNIEESVPEHTDFHVALDLSKRLNGEDQDGPTTKRESAQNKKTDSKRRKINDKSQSRLPWGTKQ
ncbi:DNA polymerase eta [[Candida] railenensis]|uniref:DNA polymerase eta n=1 Tax=[Candida] railenensis TaxID=45579 RepID=A0A9P0QJI3_9ASCO|nr:DNA polymerase eta [[Candida] railenensis]